MTKGYPVPRKHVAQRGYHGTAFDFEGEVLPRSMHGNSKFDISGRDDTYFLPANPETEHEAWHWASTEGFGSSGEARGRYRVHLTEPDPRQHIDANLHGISPPLSDERYNDYARVAPRQRIVDTHWAPPPNAGGWNEETHVEQTLPHINWRQHDLPNYKVHQASGDVLDDRRNVIDSPNSVWSTGRTRRQHFEMTQGAKLQQMPGQGELPNMPQATNLDRAMAKERQSIRADWDK